jgi:hypothetical protein
MIYKIVIYSDDDSKQLLYIYCKVNSSRSRLGGLKKVASRKSLLNLSGFGMISNLPSTLVNVYITNYGK